jgi:hypothetical protein
VVFDDQVFRVLAELVLLLRGLVERVLQVLLELALLLRVLVERVFQVLVEVALLLRVLVELVLHVLVELALLLPVLVVDVRGLACRCVVDGYLFQVNVFVVFQFLLVQDSCGHVYLLAHA